MKSNYLLIDKSEDGSYMDNSNLSCSKYEPLSLAASAAAHSLTTFEVFTVASSHLKKDTFFCVSFLEDMFHNKQIVDA